MIVFEKNPYSHTRSFKYMENFVLSLGSTAKLTTGNSQRLKNGFLQHFCGIASLVSGLHIWG
jgi:hypothetical protein